MYDGSLFSCKIAQMCVGEIVKLFPMRIVDQKKSNTLLFFKPIHKRYLMPVNVLQGKGILGTFLCIEADRNALYNSDIVYRTFLVKICQRDMPVLLVDFDRRNRGRDLLDQCQITFQIFFIRAVDQILQC